MVSKKNEEDFKKLCSEIVNCSKCERLKNFRETVFQSREKNYGYKFWRKPVCGYGDINGQIAIVGLAPAALGANRTGRVFTGDKSSDFLVSSLYEVGIANREKSEMMEDGLEYRNAFITLAVRCVPPENIPEKNEIENCLPYLISELEMMKNLKVIVCLGRVAFNTVMKSLNCRERKEFKNGEFIDIEKYKILTLFHPSPRNVNTGKIKKEDYVKAFRKAIEFCNS
ncbi:uracil-DNA glycosylase [Caldiplasma sukawensis]